jgi:hypothetical protein
VGSVCLTEDAELDAIYLLLTAAFFAASWGFVRFTNRM